MKLSNLLTIAVATVAFAISSLVVAAPPAGNDAKPTKTAKISAQKKHVKVASKTTKTIVKKAAVKKATGSKTVALKKGHVKSTKKPAAKMAKVSKKVIVKKAPVKSTKKPAAKKTPTEAASKTTTTK